MGGLMVFTVTCEELTHGWSVKLDAGDDGSAGVTAPDLRTALEAMVPVMRVIADPSPRGGGELSAAEMRAWFDRIPAVDWPPQQSGVPDGD